MGWASLGIWVGIEVLVFGGILAAAVLLPARALGSSAAAWTALVPHVLGLVWLLATERGKLLLRLVPSGRGLLWGIAGGLAMLVFGIAWSALLQVLGVETPDVASYLRAIVPSRVVLCLWGAVLVPIVEEGWFRGRFLDAVRSRVGVGWAFVLTSVGFAAIHGLPIFVPAYLVFGAVLFALRERTGSLFAPVVAHAVNNLIGILIPGI